MGSETDRESEIDEWLNHRVSSWVETYKKAMLTPAVLFLVADYGPMTVAELNDHLEEAFGWQLTERGLYRTVKRLEDSELLSITAEDAPRTGAKRKVISASALGTRMLAGIRANIVDLPGQG